MFSFGELLLVLAIAWLVLGPEKLVRLSYQAGYLWRQWRAAVTKMRHAVDEAASNDEVTPPPSPKPPG